jgi:ABC-type lipoprotein release transport system permease subunit
MYGVDPRDPLTLAAGVAVTIAAAAVASWLPAHRATRISPAETLR